MATSQRKLWVLGSCSPPAMGISSASATCLGLLVPVEGHGLFVEGVLVLLHELADGDGLGGGVGAVGVGGDDHLVAEGFADERNEFFAAADGSLCVRSCGRRA